MNNNKPVRFYLEPGGVLAVFPEDTTRTRFGIFASCYTHEGQHALSHPTYHKALEQAPPSKYESLAQELSQIGYHLCILNEANDEPADFAFPQP